MRDIAALLLQDKRDVEEVFKVVVYVMPQATNKFVHVIDRQATPHNIHATPSSLEEEELETEFIIMRVYNDDAHAK